MGRDGTRSRCTVDGALVRFTADSDAMPDVLASLARLRATGVTVNPPSLEELFMRHYHDELDQPASSSLEGASR